MYIKFFDIVAFLWTKLPRSLHKLYHYLNPGFPLDAVFLPNRTELITIKSGLNKGFKLHISPYIYREYYFGTYEKDLQSILPKIVQKNMTAYNIGANLGFFTLALSQIVGPAGCVVAFEPDPPIGKRLFEHIQLNGFESRVRVETFALSDFDGPAEFSLSLGDGRARFADLPDVKPGFNIEVSCKCLDTYVAEQDSAPDVILMDVEYSEDRVLRGMTNTLANIKPIIIIEIHSAISANKSLQELKKHDYSVVSIPELKILEDSDQITRGHYLAVHASYLKMMDFLN
jgi:FkbM family methyltransferase